MTIIGIRKLCTPSYVYLVISSIAIIIMFLQNYGNTKTYCLGSYSCEVSNTFLIFGIKIIYVVFWTWILNLICKSGATPIAWFLLLLPFILFFILIALMMTP